MKRALLSSLLFALVVAACDPLGVESFGECGDGARNKGEECDQGADNSNFEPDACRTDCTKPSCGDGVKDSGEACDRENLGQLACEDLGFDKGVLRCDDACRHDTRLCSTCGNGVAEPGEACDLGDLAGLTCVGAGFEGGTLRCHPNCEYDLSGCTGGCGNGILEAGEACDRAAVPEPDCARLGFEEGTVLCDNSCRLDLSGCLGGCGNGRVEQGETCDDGNLEPLDGCFGCREPSGDFAPHLELSFPSLVSDIDLADLDGDGVVDLLVATLSDDLNGGALLWTSGAEDHAVQRILATGPFLMARAVRLPDGGTGVLAVAPAPDGSAVYHWAPGLDAVFTTTASSDRPSHLLVTDLDGAVGDEVVLSAFQSQNLSLHDPVEGTFTGINSMGGMPGAIGRVDPDQDGTWDLVVLRGSSQLLSIITQYDGSWVYTAARYLGGRPGDVAIADVDGDGLDDVLVTDLAGPRLYALRTISGTLTSRVELALPSTAGRITAGRLDADDIMDIFVTLPDEKSVAVFSGTGVWSFRRSFTHGPCETPDRVLVHDLDSDGFLDLVFSCRHDRLLRVLRSVPR